MNDLATDEAVPPQYTLRNAYEDALAVPDVQEFMELHADARLQTLYAAGVIPFPETGGNGAVNEYRSRVEFISPSKSEGVKAFVSRLFAEAASVGVPNEQSAWPIELPDELNSEGSWEVRDLLAPHDVVTLAEAAGMHPNRLGWFDAGSSGHAGAAWEVAHYDLRYGADPDATRTTFRLDAGTGSLTFSAFNVPVAAA